jgi:hypothetical protein
MDVLGGGGSSGYGAIQGQLQQAMNQLNQNYSQGRDALTPWQQAGMNQLPGYQQNLDQGQDPFHFMNQIGQNYQQSQSAKNNINAMTSAMNNAAAASGIAGTPAAQLALAGKVNDISNADQQQYFNNIYGLKNQYMQGADSMMNRGFGASQGINQNYMGQGNALAQLYGDMGNAQLGQHQSDASGWGNLIGTGANIASMFM